MENIRLAYNNAQIGRHSGANEIFEDKIVEDLEKIYGDETVNVTYLEQDKIYTIIIQNKGTYEILEDGTIRQQLANIMIGPISFKDINGNILTPIPKIQGDGEVYIHFTATLNGGNISSVTVTNSNELTVITPELQENGEWKTKVTANGTYTFVITGNVEGQNKTKIQDIIVEYFSNIPGGLEIGSVVNYEPIGATYSWNTNYATTTKSISNIILDSRPSNTENSIAEGEARITKWKVLDIDENEKIKLVPASQPTANVILEGANGYNNAVFMLNDACKILYKNDNLGITTNEIRNINIEDVESCVKKEWVDQSKGEGYPVLLEQAGDKFKETGYNEYGVQKYPLIYAKESRAIINEQRNFGNLSESQQEILVNQNDKINELQLNGTQIEKQGTNGYVWASTSISPYQTLYQMNLEYSQRENKTGQISTLCPENCNYWIASRAITTNYGNCVFCVNKMLPSKYLHFQYMMYSNTSNGGGYGCEGTYSLFPVITISSEFITEDLQNVGQFKIGD